MLRKESKLDNPGLPEPLWSHLDGRLWHATKRDGLHGIVDDEEIKVAVGNHYLGSFCRDQGGICLFDLGADQEDIQKQFGNWSGWFGHQQETRFAVWLEIDRESVLESLMDTKAVREAWHLTIKQRVAENKTDKPRTNFIAGVEACHKGPIPLVTVAGTLLIDQYEPHRIQRLGKPNDSIFREIDAFEKSLPPHEENPLVQELLDGRRRARAKPSKE